MRDSIIFYLNGTLHTLPAADAFQTLSDFLRYQQGATGTKVVCAEGDCGACTVLIGRVENQRLRYRPINACIQSMYQLDCTSIITVEGVKENGVLNPIQSAMVENHAAQCGYCTPGFVMSLCALFEEQTQVTARQVQDALTGNLCRCTGYEPIITSALKVETERLTRFQARYPTEEMLATLAQHQEPVHLEFTNKVFYSPVDLAGAVAFKAEHPQTLIVQGATDVGVWCNKRGYVTQTVMSLNQVSELKTLTVEDGLLIVGARVTLQDLEDFTRDVVPEFHRILSIFGSPQIKHAGTLAGNIANGSPIADSLPFLFVTQAQVELTGLNGSRLVDINQLYLGYKQLDIQPDELITRVLIPLPAAGEILKLYKVSKRKDLDISSFTAGFKLALTGDIIESIHIAYGGVGPVVLRLPKTEAFLTGRELSLEAIEQAGQLARQEISPISDVRGSSQFRFQLAENILKKFYFELQEERESVCRS
ncbi:MAG TPA: xanthine dehydrogenase small subunit [Acidobacteriota bacterium]|nr:xanthine dehydrogenase small subunit [Acidobacteriota bacterium]HNG96394.1 xanthine dehydrogenase small subunit [Acidobacteriota bacterium]